MDEQLEFPCMSDTSKKPRLTLKAKKAAVIDMQRQVSAGWNPCEETWRLIDWLHHDIRASEAKKQGG